MTDSSDVYFPAAAASSVFCDWCNIVAPSVKYTRQIIPESN